MPSKTTKSSSETPSALGFTQLKGEARARALAEPGPSWTEWAKGSAGKLYIGCGMLILDALLWVSLEESHYPLTLIAAVPLTVYANYLLFAFLWARPPHERRDRVNFRPTWLRPFLIGRWDPEYKAWTEGNAMEDASAVPPEEFV